MDELVTTSEAARIAGVGVSSIKRWADQSKIRSVRTPGGHRRVDRSDLMRFLGSMGRSRVISELQAGDGGPAGFGTAGLAPGWQLPAEPEGPSPTVASDQGSYWADAMLKADVYQLQALLLSARSRHGSWHAASDEAIMGLREIGMRWLGGEITIMEEHVATERLSRALAAIVTTMPRSPHDPVCMLACVGSDQHTLGLSFLQLCLRESGWQPLWVGGSTPSQEIINVAGSGRMDMIALSASEASNSEKELSQVVAAVGSACRNTGTHLVLGGRGAWPADLEHGFRCHSFTAFSEFLGGLQ